MRRTRPFHCSSFPLLPVRQRLLPSEPPMKFSRAMPAGMICLGLVPTAGMYAQAVAASTAAPKALFITILEGEGELNDVRARTAREPIVQVEDENHKPVAGALVLFAIPKGSAAAA